MMEYNNDLNKTDSTYRIFDYLPVIIFISGLLLIVSIVLGLTVSYYYFLFSASIFLPFIFFNSTLVTYLYIFSYIYSIPIIVISNGQIRIDDLLFFILFLVWGIEKLSNPNSRDKNKFLLIPLQIWVFINAVSIAINVNNLSLHQIIRSLYYFSRLLEYTMVYFMLYDLIKTIQIKINIYKIIWLITIGICAYGIYEYFIKGEITITSTLSPDHAHIGAFLSFTFFILLGYMFYMRSVWWKAAVFAAMLVSLYVLFLSNSRTGIIAIFLGIFISLFTIKRYVAVVLCIALIGIGILGTVEFNVFDLLQQYQLGNAKFYNLESDISLLGRYYIWYVTYEFFKQHPIFLLTGIGLGASREIIGPYTQIAGVSVSGAHNQYIYYLTELGIIGFLYFMFLLYRLLSYSYKKYKSNVHKERWLYWGYFYGVITLIFNGITQDTISVQLHFNNFYGYFMIVTALVFKELNDSQSEAKL